jgi:hypothetical protein
MRDKLSAENSLLSKKIGSPKTHVEYLFTYHFTLIPAMYSNNSSEKRSYYCIRLFCLETGILCHIRII